MNWTKKDSNTKSGKNRKGFALLEVLLGMFILVVGLLAAMSLISGALKQSLEARNQATAGLLAQEGVEVALNIRDTSWANGYQAFENFPDDGEYRLNYNSAAFIVANGNWAIYQDNSTKLYNIYGSSGSPTKFKRKILISYNAGEKATADFAAISSVVLWDGNVWPSNYDAGTLANECNATQKCAWSQVVLYKWIEQ